MRRIQWMGALGALVLLAAAALPVSAAGSAEPKASAALSRIGFAPTGFPIVSQKTTMKILARRYSPIKDFIDNAFTKWYEEYTNVKIDWDLVPDADVATKVNVVLASGDLPEAFMVPWGISLTQQMVYGSQGVFLPVNDYIEKYGANYRKMLADYPMMKTLITMGDGRIYTLPNLDDFYEGRLAHKMWVWKPWMQALGLKNPDTLEDLYQVLKAFKGKDPNGNGKADEIPLSGNLSGGTATYIPFLMNSFVYAGGENYLYMDGKTVQAAYNKDGWRDGIRYLRRLYAEGLMGSETFTQDANAFRKTNATETLTGVFVDLAPWRAFPELYGNERWMGWGPVAPLTGPTGRKVASYNPYGIGWFDGMNITKAAKNPEVAFRWGEAMYDQEITLRKYYGQPDQQWRYAKAGELGINGKPAIWASLAKSGGEVDVPTPYSWMHVGPHYRSSAFRSGKVVAGDILKNPDAALYRYTMEAGDPYKADGKVVVPPLVFTEAQSTELAGLRTAVNNYVNESLARFITGADDIEAGWANYLAQLEKINVKRYLEINQAAYNGKYGK